MVPWVRITVAIANAVAAVASAIRGGSSRRRKRPRNPPPPPAAHAPAATPDPHTVSAPRKSPPPVAEVPELPIPNMTQAQRAASATIAKVLAGHPLSPGLDRWRAHLLPVLQVNAWHESRLNPVAANTAGEDSHGLFQLNRSGGVGRGHSVAEIQDPSNNTRWILDELASRWVEDDERGRMHGSVTVGDLTMAFAALVERPGSDKHPDGRIVQGRWAVGDARRATLRLWSHRIAFMKLPPLNISVGDLFADGSDRLS